ncbi:MAG: hypothetical protein O3C15_10210 [Proteobacteria bacterium]|nr:hypothetical protein [Pseudomonadota bacterium]
MKYPMAIFSSLDDSLRTVWALAAAGGLALLVLYLWSPDIAPLLPGEMGRPGQSVMLEDASDAYRLDDFVSRPLFMSSRRPVVAVKTPEKTVVNEKPAPPPQVLEGVKLLGVFSSGDAKGVILQENGGDRRRLLVGDKTGEWTLTAVEPREAVFRSGGVESRVAMGLLAAGLPRARATTRSPVKQGEDVPGEASEAPEEVKSWTPSFDNLYAKKRQRGAAQTPSDNREAEGGAADTEKRD